MVATGNKAGPSNHDDDDDDFEESPPRNEPARRMPVLSYTRGSFLVVLVMRKKSGYFFM